MRGLGRGPTPNDAQWDSPKQAPVRRVLRRWRLSRRTGGTVGRLLHQYVPSPRVSGTAVRSPLPLL